MVHNGHCRIRNVRVMASAPGPRPPAGWARCQRDGLGGHVDIGIGDGGIRDVSGKAGFMAAEVTVRGRGPRASAGCSGTAPFLPPQEDRQVRFAPLLTGPTQHSSSLPADTDGRQQQR